MTSACIACGKPDPLTLAGKKAGQLPPDRREVTPADTGGYEPVVEAGSDKDDRHETAALVADR
jgi:hypothetical protein